MRYDVAIIGTGPAGLSAAITLKIRNKNILLLGSGDVSEKVEKAHEIQNYLGLSSVSGKDMAESFREQIKSMQIEVTKEQAAMIYAMGDYFSIQTKSNRMYEASAVILATGVSVEKPYPGEEEYLGRGVSYCATCDAPLYREKCVAIIGSSAKEEAEANFLSELAKKVYYIPLYDDVENVSPSIEVIRQKPLEIQGAMKASKLVLSESELEVDGIFILRESISAKNLVPGLSMDGNHVAVDRMLCTSLKGCFACGDITGLPYQYIKAAGEGNVAALSAVQYLSSLNRK